MKILVADDDAVARALLLHQLRKWGHQVEVFNSGDTAWTRLQEPDSPLFCILDIMMPGMDGIDLTHKLRATKPAAHIMLLTAMNGRANLLKGLEAGANDYLTKPFDEEELRVRVGNAERVIRLQEELANRLNELQAAFAHVRQLRGLIPLCTYCRRVRDDANYWSQVEDYIGTHSGAKVSHSVCPECFEFVVKPHLGRDTDVFIQRAPSAAQPTQ